MDTNKLWDIVNGKCTLPESMNHLGYSKEEIKKIMDLIKVEGNVSSFHFIMMSNLIFKWAYKKLVELKKIDSTRIFNIANKSFDGECREGDLGIMGNKDYIYKNREWRFLF